MQIRCKRSHAYTQRSVLSLLADLTCWWAPKLCWLLLKPGLLFLLVPCSPHLPWKLQRECDDLASRCRFSEMHTTLWQCVQVRYAGEPIFLINYVFNNIVTVTFHCGIACFIPANRELIAPRRVGFFAPLSEGSLAGSQLQKGKRTGPLCGTVAEVWGSAVSVAWQISDRGWTRGREWGVSFGTGSRRCTELRVLERCVLGKVGEGCRSTGAELSRASGQCWVQNLELCWRRCGGEEERGLASEILGD